MRVLIHPDAESGSLAAAEIVADQVHRQPASVLGLTTGSTPLRLWSLLAERHRAADPDFSRVSVFAPDGFTGIGADHPASVRTYVRRHVEEPLDIAAGRVHVPGEAVGDPAEGARRHARALELAGGIDLQILGLGDDGHLGFNEPGASPASRTRVVPITRAKRAYLSEAFGGLEGIPKRAIAVGIADLLASRRCVLLAFGAGKAAVIAQVVEGPMTALVPGSWLQQHEHLTVIVDEAAATGLRLADYYREAWGTGPG